MKWFETRPGYLLNRGTAPLRHHRQQTITERLGRQDDLSPSLVCAWSPALAYASPPVIVKMSRHYARTVAASKRSPAIEGAKGDDAWNFKLE